MGTRLNHARWPALFLIVSLALTGCFRSAGTDLPPTPLGDLVVVGQVNTPEVPWPTADTTNGEPTAETATEFPTAIATLSPFPTLAADITTPLPTLDGQGGPIVQQPPTRVTMQPTFTPQSNVVVIQPTFTPVSPTQVIVQATYTPLPTYTAQPTYTPLPTQVVAALATPVVMQPTFTRNAPASGAQPTTTFTPVPYNPFAPTATYTPYPPVAAQVQPVQPQPQPDQPLGDQPVEAIPLGEQPTITLAPGGQGGPVFVDTPPVVAQVATLTPTIAFPSPLPPDLPTLTGGQMTATQIVYGATATMAYVQGTILPPLTTDGMVQQPGEPIVVQPGQYPPNVTLVTATPLGQVGMCGEHRIAIGETLSRIALRYGVTTEAIATANNIVNADLIEAGDTLQIPCAGTTVVAPVPGTTTGTVTTGNQQSYTVQAGDNIYRISIRFGVDMGELVRINGLNEVTMNSIYVGQQLIIPATSTVIVATPGLGTPLPAPSLTPYNVIVTPSTIG